MQIYTTNKQSNDDAFGLAKIVVITTFRQVSIFGDNYTKIVYMHSPTSFSIEKVGDDVDLDENVQVVAGPRAEEIIVNMIEVEKAKGSTFVWSGAHFENWSDKSILKNANHTGHWDPLVRDPIQPEFERRKFRRRKEDREREENDENDKSNIKVHETGSDDSKAHQDRDSST